MKPITFDPATLQRLGLLIAEATGRDQRLAAMVTVVPGPVLQSSVARVISGRGPVAVVAGATGAGGRRWCLCVDAAEMDLDTAGGLAEAVFTGFGKELGWELSRDWQGVLEEGDLEAASPDAPARAAAIPALAPFLDARELPVCIELRAALQGSSPERGARFTVLLEPAVAAEILESAGQAPRASRGAQPAPASRATVVQDALFQDFGGKAGPARASGAGGGNMELLLDVPLHLTVELGRARRTIKEVLAFGPGAVVELDRLAGEPVDVLINGKLLGKGEVVVINENFGVRVTDIISPSERVKSLG